MEDKKHETKDDWEERLRGITKSFPDKEIRIYPPTKQVSIAFAEWKDDNCINSAMPGYYLMKNCNYPLLMIDQLFDTFMEQYKP